MQQHLPNRCPPSLSNDPYARENIDKTLAAARRDDEEYCKRSKHTECLQLTADLVELFGTQVILPYLANRYKGPRQYQNWDTDLRNYIKMSFYNHVENSGSSEIHELMLSMERIATERGLTHTQWYNLINLNVTMDARNTKSFDDDKKCDYIKVLSKEMFADVRMSEAVHALVGALHANDDGLRKQRPILRAKRHYSRLARKTSPPSKTLSSQPQKILKSACDSKMLLLAQ